MEVSRSVARREKDGMVPFFCFTFFSNSFLGLVYEIQTAQEQDHPLYWRWVIFHLKLVQSSSLSIVKSNKIHKLKRVK